MRQYLDLLRRILDEGRWKQQRAKLEKMNVSVAGEVIAARPEEAHTFANLKTLMDVVKPGSAIEIVKDTQNRVVAVRAASADVEGGGGGVRNDQ